MCVWMRYTTVTQNTNGTVVLLVRPVSGEVREIEVALDEWTQFTNGDTESVVRKVNLQEGETVRVKRGFFQPRVRWHNIRKVA